VNVDGCNGGFAGTRCAGTGFDLSDGVAVGHTQIGADERECQDL
jgi:hypothetical protein